MSDQTPLGKKSISPAQSRITDTISDSAVVVNDSKDRVLLAPEQLLAQCDDDNALTLINQVKIKLTERNYALKAQECRLLDLPPELLVRIGESVLNSWPISPTKYWFTKGIFPLLQTSSHLRTQLQLLRSTPLTYYVLTDHPWSEIRATVKDWRQKGFHKGPRRIIVTTISRRYEPITAAALARALECAIYGSLLNPPAVYIGLKMMFDTTSEEKDRKFYVCHTRAENMLVKTLDDEHPSTLVSAEDGLEIWEQAKKKPEINRLNRRTMPEFKILANWDRPLGYPVLQCATTTGVIRNGS